MALRYGTMSQISTQLDTIEAGFNGRPIPVLIVEDDIDFADAIRGYLAAHGFAPRILSSAERLMEELQSGQPRLLVLDQFVGGLDLSLMLMSIRRQFSGPILLLSGNTDPTDRILSLERGADDYIVKTAPPREILARMRASLRRFGPTPAPMRKPASRARTDGRSARSPARSPTLPANR